MGRRAWTPWLTALAMDLGARACVGDVRNLPEEEQDEILDRSLAFLYYVVRSPFFERFGEPRLNRVAGIARRVPLVGQAASAGVDVVLGLRELWFYTSASSTL